MKKEVQTILMWIIVALFIALGVFTIVGGIVANKLWLVIPCILSGGVDFFIAALIAGDTMGNKPIY